MRVWGRWMLVVFVAGCGQRGDDAPGGDTQTTGLTSSTTDAPDDAAVDSSGDDDAADDEFGEEFGEEPLPAWHCAGGGIGLLDSGSLTWATPSAVTGGVTSLRLDGVDL